ncbi:MAG: hypothetical protein COT74_02335 [Bdellovibrionales bacterium CG10_big_fil_rev_8_21_14_0_10_45_34]|nr:MAG: hypothetical protein COT74_02335 [Bdellovibrionales bacterium CG10_big_fil_rev_8_21_14_0_10_45_34]
MKHILFFAIASLFSVGLSVSDVTKGQVEKLSVSDIGFTAANAGCSGYAVTSASCTMFVIDCGERNLRISFAGACY